MPFSYNFTISAEEEEKFLGISTYHTYLSLTYLLQTSQSSLLSNLIFIQQYASVFDSSNIRIAKTANNLIWLKRYKSMHIVRMRNSFA